MFTRCGVLAARRCLTLTTRSLAVGVIAACSGTARPEMSLDATLITVPERPSGSVTILHTNDIHGDLSEFLADTGGATAQTGDPGRSGQQYPRRGVIGGFPRLATAVAQARGRRPPGSVVLVDAGDTFGDGLLANLTRGAATIQLMNALGYDFMALGNHDYEYTTERTSQLQGMARFPMRGANAIVTATGAPFLGDPTLIVRAGGLRIGFLALTYHNSDQTGNKDNTRDLTFTSGIEAARRYVPGLRRRADVVVVVSHQGTAVDSVLGLQVAGIDIIVGGHSHDRITPPRRVGGAWLVQALSDASALGELTVTVTDGRVSDVHGAVHELYADRYAPDALLARTLDSVRAPFRDTLESVIATASHRLARHYKSESPVDALAAELLRRAGHADVAFLPGLGFGVTIQPGPITREMLVGLFPHATTLVHELLTGRQIRLILEQSATNLRPDDPMDGVGGLIQTAGLRWTVDLGKRRDHRISAVTVGEHALDDTAQYRAVTTSGLLQGTHRQATFSDGAAIVRDPRSSIAVLEDGMRRLGTIRSPRLGAITIVK